MTIPTTDAAHLLRRTGFGVTPDELQRIQAAANRGAAVDAVLRFDLDSNDPVPTVADANGVFAEWWKATSWWLERMRTSQVGIVEKLTLFWHDHFVSSAGKIASAEMLIAQHRTLRTHAAGDFHALTQAVAVDPAMLAYLDNWLNFSHGPQENFARELVELFTLGVGNYDESDIPELARAWTGYGLGGDFRSHQFHSQLHDGGSKSLFGQPAHNWSGPETITEILRGAKAIPASEFITAKLFSQLAYPVEAGEGPTPRLAEQFRAAELDISVLVRDILRSDEFWSDRARHALVRSPIEWMIASAKAVDLPVSSVITPADLIAAGQVPFCHPEVDGWGANDYWVSTGGSWSRGAWAARVRWHVYYGGVFTGVEQGTPAEIATAGFDRFGVVDPSPHTRSVVENWAARLKADGDAAAIPLNLSMVIMLSPEFQIS